jgi:hypothetical protein
MKDSLTSDSQQFYQYQHNEQSPLIEHKTYMISLCFLWYNDDVFHGLLMFSIQFPKTT